LFPHIQGAHYVQNFKVTSLIDHETKSWNSPFVQQVFNGDIASDILNTQDR